ncbi:MAG: histidine phosphatase family protein [Geminicoccaceae bacterium]
MLLVRHGESQWNVPFGAVRIDAGIVDPALTGGRAQAEEAASKLTGGGRGDADRCQSLPAHAADGLHHCRKAGVDIEVDALVIRERCAFSCDQGSPAEILEREWPSLDFSALGERWWGSRIESVRSIEKRSRTFLENAEGIVDRDGTLVVCHWGFILAVTGRSVDNAEIVRVPRRSNGTAKMK